MNPSSIVALVTSLAGMVTIALVYFLRGSISKQTISVMEDNKKALEDRIGLLEQRDAEKDNRIKELETEVRVIKEIPLQELAGSYKMISASLGEVHKTQQRLTESMTQLVSTQNIILEHLRAKTGMK